MPHTEQNRCFSSRHVVAEASGAIVLARRPLPQVKCDLATCAVAHLLPCFQIARYACAFSVIAPHDAGFDVSRAITTSCHTHSIVSGGVRCPILLCARYQPLL